MSELLYTLITRDATLKKNQSVDLAKIALKYLKISEDFGEKSEDFI